LWKAFLPELTLGAPYIPMAKVRGFTAQFRKVTFSHKKYIIPFYINFYFLHFCITTEINGGYQPSAGVSCYVSFMEISDICLYDEQYVGKLSNFFSYLL